MNRYFDLYLNAGDSIAPTIHVNQYDNSEVWYFTIYDEDGTIVVPTDASICGVKSDGHIILNSAVVSSNKVVVTETKQMTAAPGKATFELLLNGATHGTANFYVAVEPRPGDLAEYSASDLTLLSDAIARSQMLVNISGLSSAMKSAIIQAFENVAWDDGSGQTYIDAIINAFDDGDPSGGIVIDDYLSNISPNPVENRVIAQRINDLADATMITETASGNRAYFADGAKFPVKSLVTAIEHEQNFNGYDHPWAGGSGKNLLPNNASSQTLRGITFTVNSDGSITASGTATGDAVVELGDLTHKAGVEYIVTGCPSGGGSNKWRLYPTSTTMSTNTAWYDEGSGKTLPVVLEDTVMTWKIVVYSGNTVDFTFYPMVRLSNTDATYEPYENVCPIEGKTAVTIKREGKNLLKYPYAQTTRTTNGITFTDNGDGSITASGTATNNAYFYCFNRNGTKLYLKPGQYKLSDLSVFGDAFTGVGINYTSSAGQETGVVFTSDATEASFEVTDYMSQNGIGVYIRVKKNAVLNNVLFRPMIRHVNANAEYEQYRADTYTVSLGQTVYGGMLNVTTGELTIDTVSETVDGSYSGSYGTVSTTAANPNGTLFIYRINQAYSAIVRDKAITSKHVNASATKNAQTITKGEFVALPGSSGTVTNFCFVCPDESLTTIAQIRAYLAQHPFQLVHKLVTPITIQLTPTEVTALLGSNTITSDSGGVIVEYRADLKLYIDKRLS